MIWLDIFNVGSSKSNGEMENYNNTTINAGGNLSLTTVGDAVFSRANVEGEELIFDISGFLIRLSGKARSTYLEDQYVAMAVSIASHKSRRVGI